MATHHTSLPPRNLHRTFNIPISSDTSNTLTIKITEPDISADGLGLETWGASHVMASILYMLDINFAKSLDTSATTKESTCTPLSVLELGAGTGLVGITASALWSVPIVLTDLQGIVPGLAANILANEELLNEKGTYGACGTLDWHEPSSLTWNVVESSCSQNSNNAQKVPTKTQTTTSKTGAHLILAADCIYDTTHPALLSSTILAWLSRTKDARVVLTYPLRICYLDELNELWQLLEEGGLKCLKEGKGMAPGEEFADELLCEWSFWGWADLRDDV